MKGFCAILGNVTVTLLRNKPARRLGSHGLTPLCLFQRAVSFLCGYFGFDDSAEAGVDQKLPELNE